MENRWAHRRQRKWGVLGASMGLQNALEGLEGRKPRMFPASPSSCQISPIAYLMLVPKKGLKLALLNKCTILQIPESFENSL
jgi:hypothetical protein